MKNKPFLESITVTESGLRLDKFLALRYPDFSRTYLQKLIEQGYIKVNDRVVKPGVRLEAGNVIEVFFPEPAPSTLSPEKIPVKIVYEDEDLLVVDKPAGLTTHPAPGQTSHTLINAILDYYPELAKLGDTLRPGIVHRLDKDTSGLIIVAKNTPAQLNLINQFKNRSVMKTYTALLKGRLSPLQGAIVAPIGRDIKDRTRMAVISSGRPAKTNYTVKEYLSDCSLVEARPETGRTHQIRVHFSSIGHPIVGDTVYGGSSPLLERQFLHASRLSFRLPSTGKPVEFYSDLPEDLKKVLNKLAGQITT